MKIRTILVSAVAAGIIAGFCFAQDTQEGIYRPAQLLANLRSNDVGTRRRAFGEGKWKYALAGIHNFRPQPSKTHSAY
ncbi:MAG: hypothetical protein ABSE40_20555 [Candidatus Sulfotelmatobacter sp.]|jgi:hypothetical protein